MADRCCPHGQYHHAWDILKGEGRCLAEGCDCQQFRRASPDTEGSGTDG